MKRTKLFSLVVALLIIASSIFTSYSPVFAETTTTDTITEQQLKDNDYILYFVNAGDPTPTTVEGADKMGLYSSRTEQMYGVDAVTAKNWGLVTTTSGTNVSNATNKYGSLRYYNGTQVRDKALKYQFELPAGLYDVTLGFKNPWSGRAVNILIEGNNVSGGNYDIGSYGAEKEVVYKMTSVSDGSLNLNIQGPSTGTLSNFNDPLVNYIIIRQYVIIPISDLANKIAVAQVEAAKPGYTSYSMNLLNAAIGEAEVLVNSVMENGVDVATIQDEIRSSMVNLDLAIAGLMLDVPYDSFKPGIQWRDTNGAVIQAHGGGIMYDANLEKYYWYGEDKTHGYLPTRGVRVYSSTDLYNWKDEGLALTAIASMDLFDTDPLISQLYAGRTDKADIFNDIGTQRIIERPKVIYNDNTGKYVMWMHTDGPSATSTANYAKAEAGYAVSDSPIGPFIYGESNRLDRAPADAVYNGQPNQPGMSRDMSLFKDEDGTAYIIYSSEENLTIYISKLNDSYTDVVGWHKDGNTARDTTYKSVYGTDYVRVFPGAQREAPAMFKYDGKYYLITSGATGWAPNKGKYTVADQIFGEWKAMRDFGTGTTNTFQSQSTHVISVDPAKGKFIFMGDRWNESNLKDSRYIWLPIEFGQNDEILLKWYDEWKLQKLDSMGKIIINSVLPTKVSVGQLPNLPNTLNITLNDGTNLDTPVAWNINSADFSKPGAVVVSGTLAAVAGKVIQIAIYVIPDTVVYFVHAGGAATSDYIAWSSYMQQTLINKAVIDQKYDPASGQTWGYVGDSARPSGDASGNLFSSLRYLLSNSGDDITYKFDMDAGSYTVYVGLYDPWYQYTNGSRKANILINGVTATTGFVFTDKQDVLGYEHLNLADGQLDLTVRRATSASPDPQISWIMVVREDQTPPTGSFTIHSGAEYTNNANVTLSLEAQDDFSGVTHMRFRTDSVNWTDWEPFAASKALTLPSGDGMKMVDVEFKDLAGNISESYVNTITLDTTAPTIEFTGNQGTYSIDSMILITCSAVDDLSGIESMQCPNVEGPASGFLPGIHQVIATATDKAGNTATVEIEFTVTVDYDSLSRLTESFVTNQGVAHSLVVKLASAKEAVAEGNLEDRDGLLQAYVNELSAQSGKKLTEQQASLLISLADFLS